MTDCYLILGVSREASPAEIRAAYLAKMKQLHPDARRDGSGDADGEAGDITFAYWQLRDAHRRAEHDQLLFGKIGTSRSRSRQRRSTRARRAPVSSRSARARKPLPAPDIRSRSRRRPRGRRLQPLRKFAGGAAFALAIAGFAVALSYLDPKAAPEAQAATIIDGSQVAVRAAPLRRRTIDPTLAKAAAGEFHDIRKRAGLAGAHLYARQCLVELTARPTMAMLDYCLAFDDEAAEWEQALPAGEREARRYFAEAQRFGRYTTAAHSIAPGAVRQTMLADAGFFAQ